MVSKYNFNQNFFYLQAGLTGTLTFLTVPTTDNFKPESSVVVSFKLILATGVMFHNNFNIMSVVSVICHNQLNLTSVVIV